MASEPRIVSLREIEERNFFDADMVQNAICSVAKAHVPSGMAVDHDRSYLSIAESDPGVVVTVSLMYRTPE